jgi:hypothetical protein
VRVVARRKDAEEDAPSKAILDQLQTKTVGAPPSTTGLTGDQLPETIFKVTDFDQVKNQVTLQLSNLELLNVLNTVGQVTNTQSQSGPIPDTQKIIQRTYTSTSDDEIFFRPDSGQVWVLVGGDTVGSGGTGSIQWSLTPDSSTFALIFQTSVSGQEPIGQNSTNNNMMTPIYISHTNYLYANISAVATSVRATLSFIRVR